MDKSSAAEVVSTREFFAGFLPAALASHRDAALAMRGSICVNVHGEGSWVVRFDADGAQVEEGLALDAELVVTFSAARFAELLRGEALDPEADDPICLGDTAMLERLGRLLMPPARGGVAARVAFAKVA